MSIIYDANKIRVYECLEELCNYTRKGKDWMNEFWNALLENEAIYKEFVYYLGHHELSGTHRIAGYTVIDLFIWQLDSYQLRMDAGKVDMRCNKEELILNAFYHFLKMEQTPDEYVKKLSRGTGMDAM